MPSVNDLAVFYHAKLREQGDKCKRCRRMQGETVGHARKGEALPRTRIVLRLFPVQRPGMTDEDMNLIEKGLMKQPAYALDRWEALCPVCFSKQLALRWKRMDEGEES